MTQVKIPRAAPLIAFDRLPAADCSLAGLPGVVGDGRVDFRDLIGGGADAGDTAVVQPFHLA